jgi:hypothetical protein
MARYRQFDGGTKESERSANIVKPFFETTKTTRTYLRFNYVNASRN